MDGSPCSRRRLKWDILESRTTEKQTNKQTKKKLFPKQRCAERIKMQVIERHVTETLRTDFTGLLHHDMAP